MEPDAVFRVREVEVQSGLGQGIKPILDFLRNSIHFLLNVIGYLAMECGVRHEQGYGLELPQRVVVQVAAASPEFLVARMRVKEAGEAINLIGTGLGKQQVANDIERGVTQIVHRIEPGK